MDKARAELIAARYMYALNVGTVIAEVDNLLCEAIVRAVSAATEEERAEWVTIRDALKDVEPELKYAYAAAQRLEALAKR